MQPLQSNTELVGELISGSVEVRFECIKNIVEPIPEGLVSIVIQI